MTLSINSIDVQLPAKDEVQALVRQCLKAGILTQSDLIRACHNHDGPTQEEIDEARTAYADGIDLEIDDEALVSRGEGGLWVSAWVWLSRPTEDDEGE